MFSKVLVIAAHPDDEVLGCGGTLAKFIANGAVAHVAFMADGITSREVNEVSINNINLIARRNAARISCEILGVQSVSFGDYPDNKMDTVALLDITRAVENLIEKIKPDTIFTHHSGDLNIDHRQVHAAVATACRPQMGHPVKTILNFEVPSSTEWQLPGSGDAFLPNWHVDISQTLDKKIAALKAYKDELREWPHPRSLNGIKHLAHWRGSVIGVNAAEAYMLSRQIL